MILLTAMLAGYSFAATIAPEQLVGTYEMELNIATNAKVPIIGETLLMSTSAAKAPGSRFITPLVRYRPRQNRRLQLPSFPPRLSKRSPTKTTR